MPFSQKPSAEVTFFIESQKDLGALAEKVRVAIRETDESFSIWETTSMAQLMRLARSQELVASEVTGGLAVVGLSLAAAGLFGVSLFAVKKRTSEFGVRMAMGATPLSLLGHVLREALRRIAIAIPLGWSLAYAARRGLETQLYGVSALDPWVISTAGDVVAFVGCCAALHPAMLAARIDPIQAIRHD